MASSALSAVQYAEIHGLHAALKTAIKHVVRERPADPIAAIGQYLLNSAAASNAEAEVSIAEREAEYEAWEAEQQQLALLHRRLSSGDRRVSLGAEDELRRRAQEEIAREAAAEREAEFHAWEAEQQQLASLHRRLSSGDRRVSLGAEDELRRKAQEAIERESVAERETEGGSSLDAMLDSSPYAAVPPPPAPLLSGGETDAAAKTIAGYMRCMSSKLRNSGKGEQNAEMMVVSRIDGALVIEDHGGWALRNQSMTRMLRTLDASGSLLDFPPMVVQTGDRCIVKHTLNDGVELDLWQSQPVPEELRARLPLRRVLSMCTTPKYADVAVPDWCFDAWPEAGVEQGSFDKACAKLAEAGAQPPTKGDMLSWCGTAHHHPSRLRLMELAKEHPALLACVNVVDKAVDKSAHLSMCEQAERYGLLLDVQGKGYSSRLKLLLHTGRAVFVAKRPWEEYFQQGLKPMVHYVPLKEDLSDLVLRVEWARANPLEAAKIGAAGQTFAQLHLTHAGALRSLAQAISEGSAWPPPSDDSSTDAISSSAHGHTSEDAIALRRGDWASNRGKYDAVRMYYRWTFMPSSKDRRRPLSLIASRGVTDYRDRDVYTFGVYTGSSIKFWFEQFGALEVKHGRHWGFDSFEGLPQEAEGVKLECNAWLPGSFSAADQFGAETFGEVRDKIFEHLGPKHAAQTSLIKGFFSDSLTPTLKEERAMKPALLVDVDVDLYISALQCLGWMFSEGLIVSGTVIYYDDVSIIKAEQGGELRAHDEMTSKYKVEWRKLHDSCWEVLSIGNPTGA